MTTSASFSCHGELGVLETACRARLVMSLKKCSGYIQAPVMTPGGAELPLQYKVASHSQHAWWLTRAVCGAGSMHGSHQYMRATAKDRMMERERHRKAARLALDTSAHAGSEYHNFMQDSYKVDQMVFYW